MNGELSDGARFAELICCLCVDYDLEAFRRATEIWPFVNAPPSTLMGMAETLGGQKEKDIDSQALPKRPAPRLGWSERPV